MPERKQKLALVNIVTREPIPIHVFDDDTAQIQIPDGPQVKPVLGLTVGQYRVVSVRLVEVPEGDQIQGQPTYHIEQAAGYVYEKAFFEPAEA
jgi:hypothetical protein